MNYRDGLKIDFVGIAVNKAATTWIYRCLRKHSEICVSEIKEAHIFADSNLNRKKIENNFNHCPRESVKGEYTPSYLVNTKVIDRIKNYNSDMKLIACLRDPVQRAWSQYLHDKNLKNKNWENLEEAVEKDRKRIIERGLYYKYIKEWHSKFSEDQMLVLFFDDIEKDPLRFIQRVYGFLGVNESFVPNQIEKRISPTAFKSSVIGRSFHKIVAKPLNRSRLGRKIKQNEFLRSLFYSFAEKYVDLIKGKKESISKSDKEILIDFYEEDIDKLQKFLDKDLSHWLNKYE